jgi:hypothetical protein
MYLQILLVVLIEPRTRSPGGGIFKRFAIYINAPLSNFQDIKTNLKLN